MDNIFIKPRMIDGKPAIVRDLQNGGKLLAAAGEWKPKNQHWLRRIAQGDVIDCTAEQQTVQASPAVAPSPAPAAPPAETSPPAEKPPAETPPPAPEVRSSHVPPAGKSKS